MAGADHCFDRFFCLGAPPSLRTNRKSNSGTLRETQELLSKIASPSRKITTRGSYAYCKQTRRGEGGGERPGDCPMQERAGRAENGVRATPGDVAPHPAHQDQMREEYHGKPQPQPTDRPGKSAADCVESVESNQRTTPDGETRREPP